MTDHKHTLGAEHTTCKWGWTVWFAFAIGTDYKCCNKFLNYKIHIIKIPFALCLRRDCCKDWGDGALVSRSSYSTGTAPGPAQRSIQANTESGGLQRRAHSSQWRHGHLSSTMSLISSTVPSTLHCTAASAADRGKGADVWSSSRWRMRSLHRSLHPPPHIM